MNDNGIDIKHAVKVYKALGEPTRMKIALLLQEKKNLCCSEIALKLEVTAGSTLSHHLKQLTECGLLEEQKMGTYVYMSLNRELAKKYAPYLLT